MWWQPGAINAPDSTTELTTAEEKKPAPSAQEVTSLRNAQIILRNTNALSVSVTINTIRRPQSA